MRTNITYEDGTLAGWFDPEKAKAAYGQATRWDGSNHIGVATNSQWIDEFLYLTHGGKWVLNNDAHRYCNGPDTYSYISPDEARRWLLLNQHDEAVESHFGPLPDEAELLSSSEKEEV